MGMFPDAALIELVARQAFVSGHDFSRAVQIEGRILGMAESHPLALIKTLSSRAKSRDLLFLIPNNAPTTAAIPHDKVVFPNGRRPEESAFPQILVKG